MSRFTKFPWLALSLLTLGACSGGTTNPDDIPDDTPTGRLSVFLDSTEVTDALPPSVESVWLRFADVLVRSESDGWITIGNDREDLDLMTLRGGSRLQLGTGMIFEGPYDAVRLLIADSWIIVSGTQHELKIDRFFDLPGSGYDFSADFFVDEGVTTTLAMKWDLDTQLTNDGDDWTLGTDVDVDVSLN